MTINDKPYLVEVDEGTSTEPDAPVGAAQIIDISNETDSFVVSDLRLEANTCPHPLLRSRDHDEFPTL